MAEAHANGDDQGQQDALVEGPVDVPLGGGSTPPLLLLLVHLLLLLLALLSHALRLLRLRSRGCAPPHPASPHRLAELLLHLIVTAAAAARAATRGLHWEHCRVSHSANNTR